jgi:hypothetical protein
MATLEPTLHPLDTIIDALDVLESDDVWSTDVSFAEVKTNIQAARDYAQAASTDYVMFRMYQGVNDGVMRGNRAEIKAAFRSYMAEFIAEAEGEGADTSDWCGIDTIEGRWTDVLYADSPDAEAWVYRVSDIPPLGDDPETAVLRSTRPADVPSDIADIIGEGEAN